jgi:hypothetical protein
MTHFERIVMGLAWITQGDGIWLTHGFLSGTMFVIEIGFPAIITNMKVLVFLLVSAATVNLILASLYYSLVYDPTRTVKPA